MLRLFVACELTAGQTFELPPEAARHVQVRRLQPGDALVLFDGRGGEWTARVGAMTRQSVAVQVATHVSVDRELPASVVLAVGMPANERMDFLVEKATELGASAVQPLLCARSVLRLAGERAQRKRAHWQALAVAASEQCGRTRVPTVLPVCGLDEWLPTVPDAGTRWLLSPTSARAPERPLAAGPVVVLSGPEGGLSGAEEVAARATGFVPVTLGPRVLRADTAPLALLAWIGVG